LTHGTIAFCFVANFDMSTACGYHVRGKEDALNARTSLDVVEAKQLIVLVHIPHRIEMILSASTPCSAGGPRAVKRAGANGAPSTPGRLDRND
jgi:hypothetical protein